MSTILFIKETSDSIFNQNQTQTLLKHTHQKVYHEKYSLEKHQRTLLPQVIAAMKPGDILLIYQLSCLGKNLQQLHEFF